MAVGVMGISPKDFYQMTMWEWSAAYVCYLQANGVKLDESITPADAADYIRKFGQ